MSDNEKDIVIKKGCVEDVEEVHEEDEDVLEYVEEKI